jgi:hypothetical protein
MGVLDKEIEISLYVLSLTHNEEQRTVYGIGWNTVGCGQGDQLDDNGLSAPGINSLD